VHLTVVVGGTLLARRALALLVGGREFGAEPVAVLAGRRDGVDCAREVGA
jgi:hypothetical protein